MYNCIQLKITTNPTIQQQFYNATMMTDDTLYDSYDRLEDEALTRLRDTEAMSEEDTDDESSFKFQIHQPLRPPDTRCATGGICNALQDSRHMS